MRRLSLVPFGLLAASAFAQLPPPEADVIEALGRLRSSGPGVALTLDARETYLGKTTRTQGTLKWANSTENGRDVARVEVMIWVDGRLQQRVVADGQTVWNYDARKNTYSALPVDRLTGPQANTYRQNVETAVSEYVGGPAADLVRLARETAGGATATHRTWIPGLRAVRSNAPGEGRWAIYHLSTGQPKTVTFELQEDPAGAVWFYRFHRSGSTKVGREWRTIDAEIIPTSEDASPTSGVYTFLPPRNARSVPARAVRF